MRLERNKKRRRKEKKSRKEKVKRTFKERIEEFKLNRQGKTNKKRSDVQGRYRRVDRILTLLILIILLLFIITWIIILYI